MAEAKNPPRSIGKDPYLSFRFRVEIDGLDAAGFQEVTGLTAETEVESLREGGVNTHEWQLAGPTKYPSKLILKRGLADEESLWSWYQRVVAGRVDRKGIAVLLLDHAGEEKWRWTFRDACPVKWDGPQLRAERGEVAFESIELVHNGFIRA
ncbi:MAG: phage tail protein [Xanthomonadales bacterium]|jgi:phage tail-like protein|nr:phage tail protein [Xanthomonadales bacterium]